MIERAAISKSRTEKIFNWIKDCFFVTELKWERRFFDIEVNEKI
jgi:hypothetical protein